ncbi:hypothetical protein KMBAHK_KMBAHK_07755, partial [Dysosmobacter welbionis]
FRGKVPYRGHLQDLLGGNLQEAPAVADAHRDLREVTVQPADYHIDPGCPFVMVIRLGKYRGHPVVGVQVSVVDIAVAGHQLFIVQKGVNRNSAHDLL